jgi:hypothetical protein
MALRIPHCGPLRLSRSVKLNNRAFYCFLSVFISQVFNRSDHHLVIAMVEKIMTQADEYVRAIDMSLDTARKGCEFADDAVDICKFVAKGDAHIEDLRQFLSQMLEKAETAHTQALAMNRQFAGVRRSLFQVSAVVYGEHQLMTSAN